MPSKNTVDKLQKALTASQRMGEAIDALIMAQNKSGVLTMTLLQILIEKGIISQDEVESKVLANEAIALDADGGCKVPLMTLLAGEDDDTDDDGGSES